jgi:hypothetical protein
MIDKIEELVERLMRAASKTKTGTRLFAIFAGLLSPIYIPIMMIVLHKDDIIGFYKDVYDTLKSGEL